jgi:hypothetical protein
MDKNVLNIFLFLKMLRQNDIQVFTLSLYVGSHWHGSGGWRVIVISV